MVRFRVSDLPWRHLDDRLVDFALPLVLASFQNFFAKASLLSHQSGKLPCSLSGSSLIPVDGICPQGLEGEWGGGVCACSSDPESCLVSTCLPCISAGETFSDLKLGSFVAGAFLYALLHGSGVASCYICWLRHRIAVRFNLRPVGCSEFCQACCAPCLVLAQDRRGLAALRAAGVPAATVQMQPAAMDPPEPWEA